MDFDWSNAKEIWAKAKPMNCEEMLVEQVKRTTDVSPDTTVWVYRNAIKGEPPPLIDCTTLSPWLHGP